MENSLEPNSLGELPQPEEALEWAWQAMRAKNWQQAAERWALLRQHYPDQGPVWVQAAIAHRHLQEYDRSESLLSIASQKFPNQSYIYKQQAELCISKNNWAGAIAILEFLQAEFPDDPAGWVRLCDVQLMQGEQSKALESNRIARTRFPDCSWPWEQHAELAMARQDWQEALMRWESFRETFPTHGAGFQRAAVAAEQLGDAPLARRLKMAQEYGHAWLESFDSDGNTAQHINPPQRRTLGGFLDLVWTKARLNLKSEANQNHLRYVWWILDPLMYMAVFYMVFGLLMNRGGEGYIAYLLTGLVPFQWFAKTVQHTSGSILNGRGLMNQVKISPLFFPLVGLVQNAGKQALVFLVLFLFLIFYGVPPTFHWLGFIPIVLVQFLFMAVLCSAIALIVPFARDLLNLVPTGIQFMLFVSGIFYETSHIPERWQGLFFLNPMATILYEYRLVFIENQWPEWSALGWVALTCFAVIGVLAVTYRKFESVYPRVVIE